MIGVQGLAECDQVDLLRGERGLQAYVFNALKAANVTITKLFNEKDPLALVEQHRLLPKDDQHYNYDLAESRKAIQARQREQIYFKGAYEQ